MADFVKYISDNKDWLAIVVTGVIGISTFITSVVNLFLLYGQNQVYNEQIDLQKKQIQPQINVIVKQEKDLDDDKYGNDILVIENVGGQPSFPFKIEEHVFFQLCRNHLTQKDTVCALVLDYFLWNYTGRLGDREIFRAWGAGNNRKYCELYLEAIHDRKEELVYYSLEKVIMVKLSYVDISHESHEKYFWGDKEIDKERYDDFFEKNKKDNGDSYFSIRDVSYNQLKERLMNKL